MESNTEMPVSQKSPALVGNYRLDKTIGQGTYGKVKLAFDTRTSEKVAVKMLEKANIKSSKHVERIQREIRFLKLLHHPHIVKVLDVIETLDMIYIVMEFVDGGELFDYIVAHKRVKEREARWLFRQVLSAVDYCHQNAVIHRDLKPENLLLDRHKVVKIIDFGFGNTYKPNALLETFCGSPFYAAPEMILGKRYEGPEVDMWSLGVILFALLCGHLPFDDDNMKELYKKISSGTYSIPEYVSPESQHLIKRMMTVDPKKRATLEEIKNSPWVCDGYGGPPNNYLPERPLLTRDALKPSILHRMIAFGFTPDLVKEAFDEMHKHLKALSLKEEVKPEEGDALEPASGDVVVKRNILNPTVATYFLLSEMLKREEQRIKAEKARIVAQSDQPSGISELTSPVMQRKNLDASKQNQLKNNPLPTEVKQEEDQHITKSKNEKEVSSSDTQNISNNHTEIDNNKSLEEISHNSEALGQIPESSYTCPISKDPSNDQKNPHFACDVDGEQMDDKIVRVANTETYSYSNKPNTTQDFIQTDEENAIEKDLKEKRTKTNDLLSSRTAVKSIRVMTRATEPKGFSPLSPNQPFSLHMITEGRVQKGGVGHMIVSSNNTNDANLCLSTPTTRTTRHLSISMAGTGSIRAGGHAVIRSSTDGPKLITDRQAQHRRWTIHGGEQRSENEEAIDEFVRKSSSSKSSKSRSSSTGSFSSQTFDFFTGGGKFSKDPASNNPMQVRTVSSWFMNAATASNKPPQFILDQLLRVVTGLRGAGLRFEHDPAQPWIVLVEVQYALFDKLVKEQVPSKATDAPVNLVEPISTVVEDQDSSAISSPATPSRPPTSRRISFLSAASQSKGCVCFQVEVCKVSREDMHGLCFKRLSGGVWSYKKVCGKLLSRLQL